MPRLWSIIVLAILSLSSASQAQGQAVLPQAEASNSSSSKSTPPEASCACKGPRRPCLFVHGLGETLDGGLVDSFDAYFGSEIKRRAPCCSSIKFARLNTVDHPWHSDALQQRLCDLSLQVSNTSNAGTRTIADTIIVTHSMGNLILAGALATGKCRFATPSTTTTWVGISGPLRGSMASDYLQDACEGQSNWLIGALAGFLGRCPPNPATKSLAYEGERRCSADLTAKYKAARAVFTSTVSAVMCSGDYSGLPSSDQATMRLAGSTISHKSRENDGLVEFQSCAGDLPRSRFGRAYTNAFYLSSLNHADTTFRHGDSPTNDAQKPLKWFECLL